MKISFRHLDLYFPDNALYLSEIPPATLVLTTAYVCWTIALSIVRTRYIKSAAQEDIDPRLVVVPLLQMIPNKIFFDPLSLVLSNLIDVEPWKFVLNFVNLLIGGAFIEKMWQSPLELVKFVLGIGSLANLIVVLITICLHTVWPSIRLDLPLDGNYTVIVGFPIIYKQLFPETTIFETKHLPFISKNFRFKLLPIFTLIALTLIQLVWFHHFSQLLSIWITFFTSYFYLRFYQELPRTMAEGTDYKVIGDASETFQLIYFFPDLEKPILSPIFDFLYEICVVQWRLATPFRSYDIEQANISAQKRGAKPVGSSNAEERRKQLALQVLEERLVDEDGTEVGDSSVETRV